MYLSKDDILKADDLPVREVDVPQWGGVVRVRGLTGTERDRFEYKMATTREDPSKVQIRAEFVGRCVVDEAGKRLFTDKEFERLGEKSGAALDLVFEVICDLSGLTDAALERAAEDFAKAPDDGSPSV